MSSVKSLDELAAEEIMNNTKRVKSMVDDLGALAWQPKPSNKIVNKRFLSNIVVNTYQTNKRQKSLAKFPADHGSKHSRSSKQARPNKQTYPNKDIHPNNETHPTKETHATKETCPIKKTHVAELKLNSTISLKHHKCRSRYQTQHESDKNTHPDCKVVLDNDETLKNIYNNSHPGSCLNLTHKHNKKSKKRLKSNHHLD